MDALTRRAQIRHLIDILTVIALLTQGVAGATGAKMPPGLAEFTAAALVIAATLNARIGPVTDDSDGID
jgi:uncharacterized membrane protein